MVFTSAWLNPIPFNISGRDKELLEARILQGLFRFFLKAGPFDTVLLNFIILTPKWP